MRVTLNTNESGTTGFLDIGINQGTPNQGEIRWWEWHVTNVRNTGGTWNWNWEEALGGHRYVINLYEDGNRLAKLTHGRIAFSYHGPEPPQPWFVMTDRGNGTFPPSGPPPHRLVSGVEWSVLSIA